MDRWEELLADFGGAVSRVPGRPGVDVIVYAPGELDSLEAINKMIPEVAGALQWFESPFGLEVVHEAEWRRRADAPTMPELMSAAEIANLLGVQRQRVHQLRRTSKFPLPLAELSGGAVWDARAVRKFAEEWQRKPGRPRRDAPSP